MYQTKNIANCINLESIWRFSCKYQHDTKKEDNQPYPWVCNWHDLENIIEILQYLNKKPDDFIDYIVWRIANHPNVLSSDELDVIEGYFINSYVKEKKEQYIFHQTDQV